MKISIIMDNASFHFENDAATFNGGANLVADLCKLIEKVAEESRNTK